MTTVTQTITALPSAPNPSAPATFNTLAYPFTVAVAAMGPELNTMATQINTVSGEVNTNATNSAASEAAALASKNSAVAASNYAGAWSTLTGALAVPASVQHNGTLWLLLTSLANVASSQPGVTGDWAPIDQYSITERTSNTILAIADFGSVIKYTSGTFSQTLTAAATLGNGWYFQAANYGTGIITIDPNSAELINGAATLALQPGHAVVVSCTGTAFRAIVTALTVGDHSVVAKGNGGEGSTNTAIRRFTAVESSSGTAITYADSAANGGSFTINQTGIYSISYSDGGTTPSPLSFGLSLNSSQLTTAPASITAAARIAMVTFTGGAQAFPNISVTERFTAGDVIRAHVDLTNIDGAATLRIRKVGV